MSTWKNLRKKTNFETLVARKTRLVERTILSVEMLIDVLLRGTCFQLVCLSKSSATTTVNPKQDVVFGQVLSDGRLRLPKLSCGAKGDILNPPAELNTITKCVSHSARRLGRVRVRQFPLDLNLRFLL